MGIAFVPHTIRIHHDMASHVPLVGDRGTEMMGVHSEGVSH
jgi:hypothetical protein